MHSATRITSTRMFSAFVAILFCWLLVLPTTLYAQTCIPGAQGNNAVYNTACSGGSPGIQGSPAFIDASVFANSPPPPLNFCTVLNFVLTHSVPSTGAVIDARGLPFTNPPTSMTCTVSPWGSGSNYVNVPSTILLPAGVIQIPTHWVLPDGTKIIGEGAGGVETSNSGFAFVAETTLQACSNPPQCTTFPDSAMIQMGDNTCPESGVCHSVAIEDLSLNGQGISGLNGIVNANSQELSYVNRVNLYQVLGIGLYITGSAQNSGPYSNIVYHTGGSAMNGTCAQVSLTGGIRGIHGMTCLASSDSPVAIYLDSSNTSLEDVRIVGFYDGVQIGSTATSNVLRNIFGDTSFSVQQLTPVNVIHVTQGAANTAIMGVWNEGGSGTHTIQDDNLSRTLPLNDPYVALYAFGGIDKNSGGYSRFTTSPSANTWAAGSGDPTDMTCAIPGTIYSNATAAPSGGTALWLCASTMNNNNQWQKVQTQ